jgi:hypothetical protein
MHISLQIDSYVMLYIGLYICRAYVFWYCFRINRWIWWLILFYDEYTDGCIWGWFIINKCDYTVVLFDFFFFFLKNKNE